MSESFRSKRKLNKIESMKKSIIKLCLAGEIDSETHLYLQWLYFQLDKLPANYRVKLSWKRQLRYIEKYKIKMINRVRTR